MGRKQNPNKIKETCYMCDMPATTREHVPSQGIFPEQKDLGRDYRKNLLSVPSCDVHNSKKSTDDEYVQFLIASHYDNNPIAQKQFSTKIMRAIKRDPSKYRYIADNYPIVVNGQPSIAYSIDRDRFNKEIDHMARALYFLHNNSKLGLPIVVYTPDLFMGNQPNADVVNQRMQEIEKMTTEAVSAQPIHGENREIFFYQFRVLEEISSFVVRMVFYGGFVVIAYASPSVSQQSTFPLAAEDVKKME